MKKLCVFSALTLACGTAFASYLHASNGKFFDGNVSIDYPCLHGGEPLVIYSAPVNNMTPISSKVPIYPIYVKNGYSAETLTIDQISQSDQTSKQQLLVGNYNPATGAIHFGLSRVDQQKFYINTINFASINATDTSHFVSSFNIMVNDKLFGETIIPIKMYGFAEDVGFDIQNRVKSVEGTQYSWNQRGDWHDYTHDQKYQIPYNFAPKQVDNSDQYAGYGFWICGEDTAPSSKPLSSSQTYQDIDPSYHGPANLNQ